MGAVASEIDRLEDQLKHAFEGGAWHGPSVLEALEGISAEQAAARPIAGAHTIWELTLHLGGTYGLVLRRLKGDSRPLSPTEDWPECSAGTEQWPAVVGRLRQLNLELRSAIRRFPPERLDKPLVPDPSYSAYTQLIGVTQHDLYHAGQITLLKRALAARERPPTAGPEIT